MQKNYEIKYRKSFTALKLIFGGNEQALVLVDLLETYAYRFSEEYFQKHGEYGITEDGFIAKSRSLIMEDTGILTASVKNAVNSLEKQRFILQTQNRYVDGYKDKIMHYKLCLDTYPYLKKASDYLDKPHRPDDRNAVRKILLPFVNELADYNNIIEALKIGPASYREDYNRKMQFSKL